MSFPLFVYGTLKRSSPGKIHPLLREARFAGRASMTGRLYDLGPYPGVIRNSANGSRVFGELYELPAGEAQNVLRRIDRYEGPEYDRKRAFVTLPSGRRRVAWVYVLRKQPSNASREVLSGRYPLRRGLA